MSEKTTERIINSKEYLYHTKAKLKTILESLQWTEENVCKHFNTNSKAALASITEEEYVVGEPVEPSLPISCATKNSIVLDDRKLRELLNDSDAEIPQRFSDLQVNFSRTDKLLLYQHALEHTEKCPNSELEIAAFNSGEMNFDQIVAMKKREKKKRKYRTSKPTHIEEVRGLVDLQMQSLHHYMENKGREELRNKESCTSRDSRKSRNTPQSYDAHIKRSLSDSGRKSSRKERRKGKRSRSRSSSRRNGHSSRRRHRHKRHSPSRNSVVARKRKEFKKHKRSGSLERRENPRQPKKHRNDHSESRGRKRPQSHSRSRSRSKEYKRQKQHHGSKNFNLFKLQERGQEYESYDKSSGIRNSQRKKRSKNGRSRRSRSRFSPNSKIISRRSRSQSISSKK